MAAGTAELKSSLQTEKNGREPSPDFTQKAAIEMIDRFEVPVKPLSALDSEKSESSSTSSFSLQKSIEKDKKAPQQMEKIHSFKQLKLKTQNSEYLNANLQDNELLASLNMHRAQENFHRTPTKKR